ncbi:class I adenylate-forming enzyme family protein [Noviherbaspirillum autotrophicum]|uniref:AMP-dependent synthetase n=1 Tax=Noviherbaspirillum autotrophicum TaxID=709839 RepID=A0A0C2BMM8_9BURK|nr:class I adenylate-forming enzyme family protein [Noviherbaspirillum autotrophicum]KIF82500.1 AMP-dependent synthetase [Noviherbaspirillum autotrophicum]
MHIGNLITRHARYRPHHPAVIFGGKRLRYDAFNRRVNRLANAMQRHGVSKGQRIATLLPNCLELLEIYWAAAKTGVVVVPLSPMLLGSGLAGLLGDSDAVLLFTNSALRPVVDEARHMLPQMVDGSIVLTDGGAAGYLHYEGFTDGPETEPQDAGLVGDDVYNIMYTSGTTGLPKGIVHTHRIRANYGTLLANAFRIGPDAVVLHTGSIVFNGAFTTLMPCFYSGATYILHPQFDVEALIDTVKREKVTHMMMVPSQIVAMMASPRFEPEAMRSLQMILSLGAPLHNEHKERLNRHLPGRFYELYGLTEGFMTILDRDDALRKQGSVGVPPPFSDMRIMLEDGRIAASNEIGEIVGRGPLLMPGYFKRPDLTAQAVVDGWLYTGDLGYTDEDGYLYLVDRKKEMIDSGGVKIYPRDIEDIVVRHPLVQEVAVFGIPHEKWGETPLAAVVLKERGLIDAEALRDWINDRVSARYQRVSAVAIIDEFPRNAAGKILKRELRDAYWKEKGTRI